jgi:hypothetical protein
MTELIPYLENYIKFQTEDGSWFIPQPYNDGWIGPLGWEEELDKRNISYTIIEYTPPQNDFD